MADSWFACKGCSGSDRTQDTVKVDPNLLALGHRNKENVGPLQLNAAEKDDISKKHEAEERRRAELAKEAERQQAEEAAKVAAAEEQRAHRQAQKAVAEEAQRKEHERLRMEMEEMMRQEKAAAVAAADKAAQEAEQARQRQAARKAAEEQAKQAQELAARELAEAQQKVGEWCKLHGYENVNSHKKTMRGASKFPLHTAVKQNDNEMVGLLLKCGADQSKVNSKKQSPRQLAEKMNSNGSHDAIIALLR